MNLKKKNQTGYVPQYRFNRFDAAVMLLVVLIAAAVAIQLFQTAQKSITATSHLEAVLTVSGEEVWRSNLSDVTTPQTHKVTVSAGSLTVLAEAGKVRVASSDCPDQICVHTGWLTSAGQTAVCLPFKVVLKVISVDSQGSITTDTGALYDAISK
ncbi:MAG: NusG domain II-containing protein [Eubacteriales bacterium]